MFAAQAIPQNIARQHLNLPHDTPVLLFFGLVRAYKGLRHLLDAMPAVRGSLPSVRLLIVGEFWQDKKVYLDQIERLGVAQNVVLIDRYVPNEEVPLYFSAADAVVLPYTDVTQSGVVQLAFGFSVPVITTPVGGLPEVVADGINGMLAEPANPSSLAQTILHCFQSPGLLQKLRENVHAQASPEGWQHLVASIEHLIAGHVNDCTR
jgi:glycosyltransferase involved in cell wall biosynthesis